MTNEVKLLPCRACGNACRIERFEGNAIDGVVTIYMCANSTKFGGDCPDPHAYLNVNAWNTRPTIVTDEVVERLRNALEPFAKAADIKLCGEWADDKHFSQTDVGFALTFGDLREARKAIAAMPAIVGGGR